MAEAGGAGGSGVHAPGLRWRCAGQSAVPTTAATSSSSSRTIGIGSLTVVLLTGFFTGAALALQSGQTLDQFGARSLVGRLVERLDDQGARPGAHRPDAGRPRRLRHRRRARVDGRHRSDQRPARARNRPRAQARRSAHPRGHLHGARPDGHRRYIRDRRRLDHRRHQPARRLERLLDLGARRSVPRGRMAGAASSRSRSASSS